MLRRRRFAPETWNPLAQAILAEAAARGVTPAATRRVRAIPGRGLTAEVEGAALLLGNAKAMEEGGSYNFV